MLFERKLCAAHTWEWAGVAQRWAEQLHQGLGVRAATVKGHAQLLAIMKTGRPGEEQAGAAGKPWSCWCEGPGTSGSRVPTGVQVQRAREELEGGRGRRLE